MNNVSYNLSSLSPRDNYVDVAKGVCMLFIMCIHCELFTYTGIAFSFTFFAVPMFFFMSGFYDREMSFYKCVIKYTKRLAVPALIWILFNHCWVGLLAFVNKKDVVDAVLEFDVYNIGKGTTTWFLLALFWVKIISNIFIHLKINLWTQVLISLLLGYCGSLIILPIYLQDGMIALPFYIIGKLWHKYNVHNKYISLFAFFGLVCFILFCKGYFFYHFSPYEIQFYKPNYFLDIIFVLLTIILFLQISILLSNSCALQKFGKESLGVMLVQIPIFHIGACVLHRIFERGSIWWIICFSFVYVLIVLVSYIISVIINRKFSFLFGRF